MKLRKSAHSVYRTQYHIVWITRYRRKILNEGVRGYLETKLQEVRKYYPDWEYEAIGMEEDHVHLHMVIPPKYAVSMVVETLKKNTSRELAKKFRFLGERLLGPRRDRVQRIFRLGGRDQRIRDQEVRGNARQGRRRTSGA